MQISSSARFFALEVFLLLRHQVLVARDVHALPTCELLVPELVDQPHQTLQQEGCVRGSADHDFELFINLNLNLIKGALNAYT